MVNIELYGSCDMNRLAVVLDRLLDIKRGGVLIELSHNGPLHPEDTDSMDRSVKGILDQKARLTGQLAIVDGFHNYEPPKQMV